MKKFIFFILTAMILLTGVSYSTQPVYAPKPPDTYEPVLISVKDSAEHYVSTPLALETSAEPEKTVEPVEPLASEEDIELLALLAMAEAEGESEEGQRLVIDVVLNRVDDPHFPDTIYEVVYQENQFSGMCGERITRCYVMDELVQLAREELENRTNYDVVFFRTEHYHSYGVPMFQVGAHYFSSYD